MSVSLGAAPPGDAPRGKVRSLAARRRATRGDGAQPTTGDGPPRLRGWSLLWAVCACTGLVACTLRLLWVAAPTTLLLGACVAICVVLGRERERR